MAAPLHAVDFPGISGCPFSSSAACIYTRVILALNIYIYIYIY